MITVQESMVNIELSGELGKRFGKKHKRLVATTNEAIQALCCTISGFEMFMNKAKERGLTFAIFKNGKNIGLNDFSYPVNDETIKIVPVVIGSKKAGVLQTILGAVIIAAAVMLGPAGAGALAAGTAWNVGLAGGAMMLGGVVQMLSPQPAGLARKESADNKASYAFGGVTNTASQGYP
ncbi:TPA: tail assembly protein, partial [Klebsiella pneumoniae]|nr:tail assembly protein [Klebsiella pneumoniae]HDT0209743.1 tail assembly protein [Klebsiella pneumoniae]